MYCRETAEWDDSCREHPRPKDQSHVFKPVKVSQRIWLANLLRLSCICQRCSVVCLPVLPRGGPRSCEWFQMSPDADFQRAKLHTARIESITALAGAKRLSHTRGGGRKITQTRALAWQSSKAYAGSDLPLQSKLFSYVWEFKQGSDDSLAHAGKGIFVAAHRLRRRGRARRRCQSAGTYWR